MQKPSWLFDEIIYRSRLTVLYTDRVLHILKYMTSLVPLLTSTCQLLCWQEEHVAIRDFSAQPLIDYHATEHHMQLEECINNDEWLAYDIPRTQINILNM